MSALTLADLRKPDLLDFTLSKLGKWNGGCLPLPWSDTITGLPSGPYLDGLKRALATGKIRALRLPQRKIARTYWDQEVAFDSKVRETVKAELGETAPIVVCFANEVGIGGVGCLSIASWSSTSPLYEKWKSDYKANPNDPTLRDRWSKMFWPEVPFASPEGWIAPHLLDYWAYRRSKVSYNGLATCSISFELNNPCQKVEVETFLGNASGRKLLSSCQFVGMNLYADSMKPDETVASAAARFDLKVGRKVQFVRSYPEFDGEKLMLTEFGMLAKSAPNQGTLADVRELLAMRRYTGIDRQCYFTAISSDGASNGCELYRSDLIPVGREIGGI